MRYTPVQKNRWAIFISAVMFSIGGIAHLLPSVLEAYGISVFEPIYNLVAAFFVISGLYVILRHLMVSFTYIIGARGGSDCESSFAFADVAFAEYLDFAVVKMKQGRVGVTQCVFSLGELVAAIPLDDRGTKKRVRERYSDGGFKFYDYTVTLGRADRIILVFTDGEGHTGVMIEPDRSMEEYLKSVANKHDME